MHNENIKKVFSQDKEKILKHLKKLSTNDLYLRYGQSMTEYSLEKYFDKINFNRDLCFAYFIDDAVAGFAHIAFYNENGWPISELGLSVNIEYRNKKIGFSLLEHSINESKKRGAKELYIHTMTGNKSMYNMLNKFKTSMTVEEQDVSVCLNLNDLNKKHKIQRIHQKGHEFFIHQPESSKATFLFVHGAGGDSWQFRRYLMPYFFENSIGSIAVSLPNHGDSSNHSWGIDQYIDAIKTMHEIAIKENPEKPIVLVGHSMGGLLVQKYVSENLKDNLKLDSLVLMASVPPYNPSSMNSPFANQISDKLQGVVAKKSIYEILSQSDPIDASKINIPIFCVAAKDDQIIDEKWSLNTSFYYRTPLYTVQGGHNLMTSKHWPESVKILCDILLSIDKKNKNYDNKIVAE